MIYGVPMSPAARLLELLATGNLTIATAESLTGGLLCSDLVSVPGASHAVLGGVVSYATEVKVRVLGVPGDLVATHGVISAECAAAMAQGARVHLGADVGVSTTGVAGPDSQEGQPVGTVFIGVSLGEGVHTMRYEFAGDRQQIREAAVAAAIGQAVAALSA